MVGWRRMGRTAWYRSLPHVVAFFLLSACGGGGCGGCGGCGVAPIPGGFKLEERVPNSAQVRLTEAGIQWMEDNGDALVGLFLPDGLEFEVPPTSTTQDMPFPCGRGTAVDVCTGGNCLIRGTVNSLQINPSSPNRLEVILRLTLQTRLCSARDSDGNCTASSPGPLGIQIDGGALCSGGVNATIETVGTGSRDDVGIVANLAFQEETRAARAGYTKVVVESVGLEPGREIEEADIMLDGDGGLIGFIVDVLPGLVTGLLLDSLQDQVGTVLQEQLDQQLCTKTGEYGCPTGTVSDDPADPMSFCRFSPGGECVPVLLGTDGQGDLGAAFLGSVSPGTHAPGQFLLASGGEGEAVNNGLSLFFYGGFLGTSRNFMTTPAHNPCVPALDPPPIPTIPRVATFRGNTVPGLDSPPHVGIGLSESFLDHAGYGMYDAGLLCIGAGTPLSQQLSTGLFSLLVPSLNRLAFPERNAPLAVTLRPQTPPDFEIGAGTDDDPLLTVSLDQLQIDFYVWSADRFVRFMTFEADFSIPINLTVVDGEIVPSVLGLSATNASVTNQEVLLTESPEMLASVISDVLSSFASMAFGDLGGFALPELMGLELQVPEGGIRGLEEDGEEFLGIFANLAVASTPMALSAPADTFVEVSAVDLDPEVMTIERWGQGLIPRVTLSFDAEGPAGVEYEYSYRLDGMQWSPWTREREVLFESRTLLFQARHTLEARARVVGEPASVDLTPAVAEILVDVLPPSVELEATDAGVVVDARDVLSEQLLVRFREAGGDWSEWDLLTEDYLIGTDAEEIDVEVQDEAGNIGSASSALIRGRPNPATAGSGCGCTVPGQSDERPLAGLLLLGLLGLVLGRRHRTPRSSGPKKGGRASLARYFLFLTLTVALGIGGCDCGSNPGPDDGGLDGGADATAMDGGLGLPLDPGQLATHLDMAALPDGTLVLSGYSPGVPPSTRYGDLVVGAWDPASESVAWEIVDGVPDIAPTSDPSGWRGGIAEPGDDVGQYSSLGTDGTTLMVSYFDATNGALKFASGELGGSWQTHTVDDEGWAGAYSDLTRTDSGVAVAYLGVLPPTSLPGRPTSEVRVATAGAAPSGATDWTIARIGTTEIDCRPQFCPDGAACLESGECVDSPGDQPVLPDPYIEDRPPAVGLFPRLAPTASGLALVYYDRAGGNLMGAEFDGSAWGTPFLIDGYGVGDPDVGDSGIGASLAVDAAGAWHITYVDGAEETLRYARVEGGSVTRTEIVDDGTTDGTSPHPDGRHIVGDDSSLVVTDGGELRVAYQDATSQRAMFARSTGDGTWSIQVLDSDDSAGYFTRQVLLGTTSFVAHWWRREVRGMSTNGVRIASVD